MDFFSSLRNVDISFGLSTHLNKQGCSVYVLCVHVCAVYNIILSFIQIKKKVHSLFLLCVTCFFATNESMDLLIYFVCDINNILM